MHKKTFFTLILLFSFQESSFAQNLNAELEKTAAEILSTGKQIGGWLARESGTHFGFSASSGDIVPAPILGFPHFRLSVGLGATLGLLNIDSIGTLPDFGDEIIDSIPLMVLVPLPQFSIRAGLPGSRKTDIAIRAGGFPRFTLPIEDPKISLVTRLFGLTLRQKLLGGLSLPSISLEMGFSRASGEIDMAFQHDDNKNIVVESTTYKQETNILLSQTQAWSINTWSFLLKFSKKLPFFQPWIGTGIQWYKGHVTSISQATGTTSLEDIGNPNNSAQRDISDRSVLVVPPKNKDFKFLAGFWLGGAPFAIAFQYETQFTNDHAAFVGLTSGF